MSARKLSPEEDRELWILTRLEPGRTIAQTLARRRKLEVAYRAMTSHNPPENVHRYGQRLGHIAQELFYRGVSRP